MKHYHIVSRIAIYLLSVILIAFGIFHYKHPYDLLVYVPDFLPGGVAWVYIVGTAFILAGVSFLTNKFVKITGYLLAAMLIVFVLTIHLPNSMNAGAPEMRQMALINLLKDTAIAAFALHIAAGAYKQHLHFDHND
ncbi:DoxX family protein [Lacibacter luteus]|uniref:DoxX family protein n=1 Tax=Lacibacter luteus TaxID=2508719 RepID=A0A4V1M816_9BACT|nr:DoxX family protein [Lacibacter luteus]RXK62282.1 DoxX family protein [Lacibacter luteus]